MNTFADVYEKSQNTAFRNRLTVAIIEQCRWTIQTSKESWPGGITPERYDAMQNLARVLRAQSNNKDELTRIGIYALLPWGSFDPDDDAALQGRIAEVFAELSGQALPA